MQIYKKQDEVMQKNGAHRADFFSVAGGCAGQ
jgi:hypothetical protein